MAFSPLLFRRFILLRIFLRFWLLRSIFLPFENALVHFLSTSEGFPFVKAKISLVSLCIATIVESFLSGLWGISSITS